MAIISYDHADDTFSLLIRLGHSDKVDVTLVTSEMTLALFCCRTKRLRNVAYGHILWPNVGENDVEVCLLFVFAGWHIPSPNGVQTISKRFVHCLKLLCSI